MKEKIMQATSDYDLIEIENEVIEPIRNNFYNELLKDKEIEQHLCEIFKVDKYNIAKCFSD